MVSLALRVFGRIRMATESLKSIEQVPATFCRAAHVPAVDQALMILTKRVEGHGLFICPEYSSAPASQSLRGVRQACNGWRDDSVGFVRQLEMA